jgi:hypothetical protein
MALMAENVVDAKEVYEIVGYVGILSERTAVLDRAFFELEAENARTDGAVSQIKKRAVQGIYEAKEDVEILKSSIRELQKVMISMIGRMKNTLKNDDFDRFEKRVDYWAPEKLVNRREARRLLQQMPINK